jgi:CheY-like chemotaxis protein
MSLAGKKVLVVEDDRIIALDIASELKRAGCTVIGPAPDLETAMALAGVQHFDAAVLDVFLEGSYIWTLAAMLAARAIPFIFLTGFGGFLEFPAHLASVRRLDKPARPGAIKRELGRLLDAKVKIEPRSAA